MDKQQDDWTYKLTKEQFSMYYPNFPVKDIVVGEDGYITYIRAGIAVQDTNMFNVTNILKTNP